MPTASSPAGELEAALAAVYRSEPSAEETGDARSGLAEAMPGLLVRP